MRFPPHTTDTASAVATLRAVSGSMRRGEFGLGCHSGRQRRSRIVMDCAVSGAASGDQRRRQEHHPDAGPVPRLRRGGLRRRDHLHPERQCSVRAPGPGCGTICRSALEKALAAGVRLLARRARLEPRSARTRRERRPSRVRRGPARYRYDVVFLIPPARGFAILPTIGLTEGVDEVLAAHQVLYLKRLTARASQSRLSKLTQHPAYANMTIRNWNTTRELWRRIQEPSMRKYVRRTLLAAALLLAVPVLLAGLAWWFEWGPGFRRQCDRLATVAGILPGMTVADIGAGGGAVAVRIASRLGPSGRLYATELFESHLEEIRNRATAAGLASITTVHAADDATGLPAGCCDVIYMRRVYHHLEDPKAIAAGIDSSLRPGGRLVVIDMITPHWIPNSFQHGIPSEDIRAGFESAGFQLERRIDWWSPIDYCLVFRKRAGSSSMHGVERLRQRLEDAVGRQVP